MVNMEMMNNVVDKQGWFGSIQMDEVSDLTATHMHQQQQQLFEQKILNIGHLMLINKSYMPSLTIRCRILSPFDFADDTLTLSFNRIDRVGRSNMWVCFFIHFMF
jgi:hypothetical protein